MFLLTQPYEIKYLWGKRSKQFDPNFFNVCRRRDFTWFHRDAQISLKFFVTIFFDLHLFLIVNRVETSGFSEIIFFLNKNLHIKS